MSEDEQPPAPEAVLAAAFPDQEVRVVRPLEGRQTNAVYEILVDGDRMVLKQNDRAGWRIEKEAAILRRLGPVFGIPVPEVTVCGTVGETRYLVTEFCDGGVATEVDPMARDAQLFDRLGRVLARIHDSVAFAQAGNPIAADGDLRVDSTDGWQGALEALLDAETEILDGTTFASAAHRARRLLANESEKIPDSLECRLLHSDLNPNNVFVDTQGAVSCVIDWEYAQAGDPVWDLASVEWSWFEDGPFDADRYGEVLNGYASIRDIGSGYEDRRRLYRALLPVGRMVGLAGGSEASHGDVTASSDRVQDLEAKFDERIEAARED